ncbi:hypothetical protein [Crossiella sp. CA198]
MAHFRGLTLADIRGLHLDEYRALVDAMAADLKARQGKPGGERREPVMR